jgi:hypothetical protein
MQICNRHKKQCAKLIKLEELDKLTVLNGTQRNSNSTASRGKTCRRPVEDDWLPA